MILLSTISDFFSFSDPNVLFVLAGMVFLGISSSTIGTFAFLRKRSLTGDAIAHSVLPGICLAFLLFDTRNLWVLLGGAFVTGWLSIFLVDIVTRKSRIKTDAAIGIALSVFFGAGIVLLTYIQQTGNAGQSGLNNFLLGKAAAMSPDDIITMMVVSGIIVLVVVLFFKEFTLLAFDPEYARASGMPIRFLETLLTTLTVMAVAVGIQAVGVVLMAAMLITPPAAARFWTNNLKKMVLLSVAFGILGGFMGAFISYTDNRMPTGPWVVTMTSLLVLFSLIAAPGKGLAASWLLRRRYGEKVGRENTLKVLYHLKEQHPERQTFTMEAMLQRRSMDPVKLARALRSLIKKGMVVRQDNGYQLNTSGEEEGKRIVRIHRLWEMYLTEKMNTAADHVHDDAEAIEHIITPEMEEKLARLLDFPDKDPHNKTIPW
ncbi:MAG: zinc ABC transporter permease [Sphingobacteriales bacterium BACL12 MAG-120813-bin55]|nr:MAG: zinc ABC transporter permease [Sphingobacteriales bacterium BACL12 MAG-120813-bin55]